MWNGHNGTFTMNPATSAMNSQNCVVWSAASFSGLPRRIASSCAAVSQYCTFHIRSGSENVICPVCGSGFVSTTPITPTSVSRLPARV